MTSPVVHHPFVPGDDADNANPTTTPAAQDSVTITETENGYNITYPGFTGTIETQYLQEDPSTGAVSIRDISKLTSPSVAGYTASNPVDATKVNAAFAALSANPNDAAATGLLNSMRERLIQPLTQDEVSTLNSDVPASPKFTLKPDGTVDYQDGDGHSNIKFDKNTGKYVDNTWFGLSDDGKNALGKLNDKLKELSTPPAPPVSDHFSVPGGSSGHPATTTTPPKLFGEYNQAAPTTSPQLFGEYSSPASESPVTTLAKPRHVEPRTHHRGDHGGMKSKVARENARSGNVEQRSGADKWDHSEGRNPRLDWDPKGKTNDWVGGVVGATPPKVTAPGM